MIKKLSVVLIFALLLTACSESVEKTESKREEKSEQSKTEDTEAETVVSEPTEESEPEPEPSAQFNADDEEFWNAAHACHTYIPDSYSTFKASLTNTQEFTIDDEQVKKSLFLAEEGYKCISDHFDDASGTVIFPKSLDAFTKASSELIFFKGEVELYLKNHDKDAYVRAAARSTTMVERYEEFGKVFAEEAKQAGLIK